MNDLRLGRVADPLDQEEDDPIFKTSGQAYAENVVPLSRGITPPSVPTIKPGQKMEFDLYGSGSTPQAAPKAGTFEYNLYPDQQAEPAAPTPEKKPGPLSRIGSAVDSAITFAFGENKAPDAVIDKEGLAQYKADEAEENLRVMARRKELGTDDPNRGALMRHFDSAAAGLGGALSGALEWIGDSIDSKAIKHLAQLGSREAKALTPQEQTTLEKLSSGIGSVLAFAPAGFGIGAGLRLLGVGLMAARGGAVVGASALESAGVAQEAYEKAMSETGNKDDANRRAWAVFIANAPITAITNKLGIFGESGGVVKKLLSTVASEGVQEGSQEAMTNLAGYKEVGKGVSEAAAIGGLAGGGFKGGMIALERMFAEAKPEQREEFVRQMIEEGAQARRDLFGAMMQDETSAAALRSAGIESGDDPRFQPVAVNIAKLDAHLKSIDIPTDEERVERTNERGADVRAAFGDTASTSVGVGTGATEPVLRRDSVVPNPETKTLDPVGAAPEPVRLAGQDGSLAMSPEDMIARNEGFEVQPAFQVGKQTVGNRFVSEAQAATFLFGPLDKNTGQRVGGYATSVPDMEFQIRRGQRSKAAGGGTFYFVEGREAQTAQNDAGAPAPAPVAPITSAPAASAPAPATQAAAPVQPAAPVAEAPAAPAAPTPEVVDVVEAPQAVQAEAQGQQAPAPVPRAEPAPAPAAAAPAPVAEEFDPLPPGDSLPPPPAAAPGKEPGKEPKAGKRIVMALRKLGGVAIDEASDTVGETGRNAARLLPGLFTKLARNKIGQITKGHALSTLVHDGMLNEYLPPDMRNTSDVFDADAAVDYLRDVIREDLASKNGLPFDDRELASTGYNDLSEAEQDAAAEVFNDIAVDDDAIANAREMTNDEVEAWLAGGDEVAPAAQQKEGGAGGAKDAAIAEERRVAPGPAKEVTPKKTVEQQIKEKVKAEREKAKAAKPAPAAKKETPKPDATKIAEMDRVEAVALWEDNDDGKNHIPFASLSKDAQNRWLKAYSNDPKLSRATTAMHDDIVDVERRNERNDRLKAKMEAKRPKGDGVDLSSQGEGRVELAHYGVVPAQARTISDLTMAIRKHVRGGENFSAVQVPIGNILGKKPGAATVQRLAQIFNKKLVFFSVTQGPNYLLDGAVMHGSDTIFINVNASRQVMRVFGHELVHAIRNSDPDAYAALVDALAPQLDERGFEEHVRRLTRMDMAEADANDALNKAAEEAIADIVGDRFAEEEFWIEMAQENPSAFQKIANAIVKFINDVLAKLNVNPTLGSEKLISDLTFAREQIAKVLNEHLDKVATAETTGGDTTMLSRPKGEVFYSALKRAFESAKMETMPAAQWKSWLQGNAAKIGVKKEEIEHTGVMDWLDLQQGKVTKEQVANFVGGNQLHVNDILLTENPDPTQLPVGFTLPEFREPDVDELRDFVRDRRADDMVSAFVADEEFEQQSPDDMSEPELRRWIADNYGWQNFMREHRQMIERARVGAVKRQLATKHGGGDLVLPGGKEYVELVMFDPSAESYKEHDDIHYGRLTRGRALGWLRMNVRKDAAGNDTLFIEEIQSQRGQDARDPGNDVPKTPIVGETKAWSALLLKRAIAYAQEKGIDRIAWTTGEQQSTRYGMAKQVGTVYYIPKRMGGIGRGTLVVTKKDKTIHSSDGTVVTEDDVSPERIAEFIGKDAAERLLSVQSAEIGNDLSAHVATAEELGLDRIGGEGMTEYYDRILPSVASKLIEKHGGKTEVMKVDGRDQLGFVVPAPLQQMVAQDGFPMFSRKAYEAQFEDLPQAVRDMAVAKGHYTPPTIRERLEALKPRMWMRVVQGTFDRFRSVRDISLKAYMQLRLSSATDGALEGLLHYGQVENDDGALKLKQNTKGLLEILKPVGSEVDRFLLWIAANRAGELKQQDRERFFADKEIVALKAINLGKMKDGRLRASVYAETLRDMNTLNKSVLDLAKQTGLIDDAAFNKFASDIWYVPFYRVMEDEGTLSAAQNSSASVGQYLSKKLKGSERQLNDLMQNVLLNWSHILSASMKNQAAVETLHAAEQLGGVVSKLKGQEKGAVKVMVNGKETFYQIDDEFLLASLQAVASPPSYGMWTQTARAFKTTLTRMVSLNPAFKINNLLRDSLQSIGLTGLKNNPIANVMEGWKAYGDNRADALVGGALFKLGNAFDGDSTAIVKRVLKDGTDAADVLTTPDKAKAWFGKAWDKYDDISDRMENTNRIALYQQMRAKGASHLEASYAARDLQDFGLQGNFVAIRYAAQILPYFNARLQGMYKLGRDGLMPTTAAMLGRANDSQRQKAAKFAIVLGAITALELALYLGQMDDEDWKKREEWDKDGFWWFKIPGTEYAARVPKPFEMGAIATVIGRATEQMVDSEVEGKVFGKRLLAILRDNLAINPIPQVVRPLVDLNSNKDSFTGRPIESPGLQRLSPEMRIGPGTSMAGISMATINGMFADFAETATGGAVNANNMKLSPIQYDYLLRGYLAWFGGVIQNTSNFLAVPFTDGERPDMRVDQMFVVGTYVKELPQSQSRYVSSFYENAKDIAMAAADYHSYVAAGEMDKAREELAANGDKIGLSKLYAAATKKLGEISKRMRAVEGDDTMTGEQKRLELDRLAALRIEYAKRIEGVRVSRSRAR